MDDQANKVYHMRCAKKVLAVPPAVAPTTMQPPLLVPCAEAARLLSVSTWEIRRLVHKGALRAKKLGKTHWLIVSKSIDAFASEGALQRSSVAPEVQP